MKHALAILAVAAIPTTACAQTPDVPEPPATPEVATVTEDCGDSCQRTVTTIKTSETGDDGTEIITKKVKVIELKSGSEDLVDLDVDVETDVDGEVVHKRVKVIKTTDGEITPEMQAKIDTLIADAESGEGYVFKEKGDGLVVMNMSDSAKKTRVIIRDGDEEILNSSSDVSVDQVENEDGSRTIRITPDDGSETTVITIQKEKLPKNDN